MSLNSKDFYAMQHKTQTVVQTVSACQVSNMDVCDRHSMDVSELRSKNKHSSKNHICPPSIEPDFKDLL